MKKNTFKFRVNYAGDVDLTTAKGTKVICGSPYDVSEEFRKMLYKTLCDMTVQVELVVHVTLEHLAES